MEFCLMLLFSSKRNTNVTEFHDWMPFLASTQFLVLLSRHFQARLKKDLLVHEIETVDYLASN